MVENVLTIGSTEMEAAKVADEFAVDTWKTELEDGVFAILLAGFFDFFLALGRDFFDSAWLDAAVLD